MIQVEVNATPMQVQIPPGLTEGALFMVQVPAPAPIATVTAVPTVDVTPIVVPVQVAATPMQVAATPVQVPPAPVQVVEAIAVVNP